MQKDINRYLDILEKMVAINSWTENGPGVDALGDYTARLFAPLGFTAEKIPAAFGPGSHLVLKKRGKGSQSLGLVSHLDTVYPPEEEKENDFRFAMDGNLIYGPGTNDIKGGTLLIYMLIEALAEKRSELYESVNWCILLDATEETRSDDFGLLCRRELPAEAAGCLVFEAGNFLHDTFSLVTARKGRGVFRIAASGRGGHAGTAHRRGASAIDLLTRAAAEVNGFTDYDRGLTFNIGGIRGGSGLNRIAENAEADVEMRAFDPEAFAYGREKILSLAQRHTLLSGDGSAAAKLTVEEIRSVPAWPDNEKTNGLFAAYQRAAKGLGFTVEKEERGGLSDGNWIWDHVPVLDGLGPAGEFSHMSGKENREEREYILVSSLIPKTLLNVGGVEEILKG